MKATCSPIWSSFITLGLLTVASFSQPATAETITGQSGNVRAEISYEKAQDYQYKNLRLKIIRAGKTVFDRKPLAQDNDYDRPLGAIAKENQLPIVDLDGDKEPEVIADFFTGGAHCCTYSLIYRFDKSRQQYTKINHAWGNGGYGLKDLDKDGLPEFESRDDRFAYAFTSYAASSYPVQIYQYRNGKMVDVTRRYPKIIKNHASELWQFYLKEGKQYEDGKGILAAYLADKYMLGQGEDGWVQVRQAYKGRDRNSYFADLRKFLRETGYIL
ncbi:MULTISPECIES: hypothetical protein [Nostocales]|uniref:WD-40 repeat-containing protein n=3 Tax=Nostocales TaxID=1161 RepID=A0A0C1R567_9CYAN|nr:hypothetical protein [Tolypothrix bouteillei]KAF3888390.1 hypothetical protein DA73_0400025040 [Tolypothrix bouteillei VB521301]